MACRRVSTHVASLKSKGFTLIEVMVALAIIAIALASLIKASGNHTNSAAYLKSKTLAHYVAMNEVAKIQIEKAWPDLGTKKDVTDMADTQWFWTREIEKTADESGNIRGLKFTIYADENRTRSLDQIQAFIANPASNLSSLTAPASQTGASGN